MTETPSTEPPATPELESPLSEPMPVEIKLMQLRSFADMLVEACDLADDAVVAAPKQLFIVCVPHAGGVPTVEQFSSYQAVADRLAEYLENKAGYYTYPFLGERVEIKHRPLRLVAPEGDLLIDRRPVSKDLPDGFLGDSMADVLDPADETS